MLKDLLQGVSSPCMPKVYTNSWNMMLSLKICVGDQYVTDYSSISVKNILQFANVITAVAILNQDDSKNETTQMHIKHTDNICQ